MIQIRNPTIVKANHNVTGDRSANHAILDGSIGPLSHKYPLDKAIRLPI